MGNLLKGKKVGIVGFGRIGQKVAKLLHLLGAEIIFSDIRKIECEFQQVELLTLLNEADIISFHASGKRKILTKEMLDKVKNGVIIINTARGELIEEEALYQGLKTGIIAWACVDVFEKEPYDGLLKELDNVTLTSHIGSYAFEARREMEYQAVLNLLKGLEVLNEG